jgi:formate-nitrite transporter family protein
MIAGQEPDSQYAPELTRDEEVKSKKVESTPLPVIHEVIRRRGEDELARSNSALAWSGLAAGLTMGFSMISEGLIRSHLPDAPWAILVSKLGYSVGFLMVILGRQQLFTENTITPVIPVLARRDLATALQTLRLWVVVLTFNVIGALCIAWVLGHTNAFDLNIRQTFNDMGMRSISNSFATTLIRGIFAGWLIAFVVWLIPATPNERFFIILLLTWLVGVGELSHSVAGAVETLYVVVTGSATWHQFFFNFLIPAVIGNTIGGVSLVAVLNHAQLVAGHKGSSSERDQTPNKQAGNKPANK